MNEWPVVEYDYYLWREAERRAAEMPIYHGSHRGIAANQVGALGEIVTEYLLADSGLPCSQVYRTTHDISVVGVTIEVKTKDRTVIPQPTYDCSLPLYNHAHQRPAAYIFVSLLRDKSADAESIDRFIRAYLVGWLPSDEFEKVATVWTAGSVDPDNGTKFWTDCLNVRINQLRPFSEFVRRIDDRMMKGAE